MKFFGFIGQVLKDQKFECLIKNNPFSVEFQKRSVLFNFFLLMQKKKKKNDVKHLVHFLRVIHERRNKIRGHLIAVHARLLRLAFPAVVVKRTTSIVLLLEISPE